MWQDIRWNLFHLRCNGAQQDRFCLMPILADSGSSDKHFWLQPRTNNLSNVWKCSVEGRICISIGALSNSAHSPHIGTIFVALLLMHTVAKSSLLMHLLPSTEHFQTLLKLLVLGCSKPRKIPQEFKTVVKIDFCQATFEKFRLEIDVPTYVEWRKYILISKKFGCPKCCTHNCSAALSFAAQNNKQKVSWYLLVFIISFNVCYHFHRSLI